MVACKQDSRVRQDLKRSVVEGGAHSVMVGIGETYLPAFALALGMGEVTAGLVASTPMLVGAVLQLVAFRAVVWLGSLKRWVVLGAMAQALSLVPLMVAALTGHIHRFALFAAAALYWGSAQSISPAWNTWMEHLVPRQLRARYFAWRSRVAQACILVGLLAGGLILDFGEHHDAALMAFAVTFAIAAASRLVGVRLLAAQHETPLLPDDLAAVPARAFVRRLWHAQDGRLVLYMLVLQVAVNISGPFFSPFMLSQIHLSYPQYTVLIAVALVARIVTLPLLGRLAHRFGAKWLLWFGGVGVVPLAAMWIVSANYIYLLCAQAFAGLAWAALELATQLLFFEMIRHKERTSVLSLYNFASACAVTLGAVLGGTLLSELGHDHTAYTVIFALSSASRLCSVVLLLRVARVPKQVVDIAMRFVALRPSAGAVMGPIIASVRESRPFGRRRREGDHEVSERVTRRGS